LIVTEVILVRHATTDWTGVRFCGLADPPLNDVGRREARELAAGLASTFPGGVRLVTSPLRRARETADAIARAAGGIDVVIDERWQEVDMGDAEGLTWDEVEGRWPELAAGLVTGPVDVTWPGGDPAGALAARVRAALADLANERRTTVVVSHGGPIRYALRVVAGSEEGDPGFVSPGQVVRIRLEGRVPAGA
jgi:broad specificity phosphatase PhoE